MTTSVAPDAQETWEALLDGASGIRTLDDPFIDKFGLAVRIGGHLREDFDSELTRVELRRLSYQSKMSLALALGRRAWANAGAPEVDTKRLAVSIGTGLGSTEEMVFDYADMRALGLKAVYPTDVQKFMPNGPAATVGLELQAKAGVSASASADASGAEAIVQGWRRSSWAMPMSWSAEASKPGLRRCRSRHMRGSAAHCRPTMTIRRGVSAVRRRPGRRRLR